MPTEKVLKEAHGCKATAYAQGATVWLWAMWTETDVTKSHTVRLPSTMTEPCCILPDWDMAMRSILLDLDPDRPGLEYYMVHEEYPYGSDLRDARTGEILFRTLDKDDTGRGVAADIDSRHRGYEYWCSDAPVVGDIKGKTVSAETSLSAIRRIMKLIISEVMRKRVSELCPECRQ